MKIKINKSEKRKRMRLRVWLLISKLPPTSEKGPETTKTSVRPKLRVKRPQKYVKRKNIHPNSYHSSSLTLGNMQNENIINRMFMGQLDASKDKSQMCIFFKNSDPLIFLTDVVRGFTNPNDRNLKEHE